MSYRLIRPVEEGVCPICGSKGYLQEDDEEGDVRYSAWCSNPECSKASIARYSRKRGRAVSDFLKDSRVGTP